MTNPLRENNSRNRGQKAPDASVVTPPEPGSRVTRQKAKSGTAGESSEDAPRQFTAEEAFVILVDAVAALEGAGKRPTAAGVSARMRLLHPGFARERTEFATFRELVQAAQMRGFVSVAEGQNDIVISLPSNRASLGLQGSTLRSDLWRATLDWSEGARYYFDRASRHTRPASEGAPTSGVLVPSVSKEARIDWMRDFAAQQRGEQLALLEGALAEVDPSVTFHRAVRSSDAMKRRWNRHLRSKVLETVIAWAAESGISESDIFVESASKTEPRIAEKAMDDDALRARVLGILEVMPLHELLRLPIPLEYALTR